jgi:hypothetical protein
MRIKEIINTNLSREYFIASINPDYDAGVLRVTFNVNTVLDGTDISSAEEPSFLTIPFGELVEWSQVEQKIVNAKQLSLNTVAPIQLSPDFQGFYNELLISQIFSLARELADSDVSTLAAYGDFATAITNCIQGNVNIPAFQVCLNNLLSKLPSDTDLSGLSALFIKYRIPLSLPNSL